MEPKFPGLRPGHALSHVFERVEENYARRQRARVWRRRGIQGLAIAAAAAVGVLVWSNLRTDVEIANAPLHHKGGAAVAVDEVFHAGSEVLFAEGSRLAIGSDTQLAVLENSQGRFQTRLERGRISLNVTPSLQPRRQWSIRAGDVTVAVVGTQFTVSRMPDPLMGTGDQVEVTVRRGRVRVSGPTVEGGEQMLAAGERLTVRATAPSRAQASSGRAQGSLAREEGLGVSGDGAQEGSQPPAVAEVQPDGVDPEPSVLRQSDALRRRGEHRAAAKLLRDALARGARGREAALLAFTLGRIQLDSLGEPRAAARSFGTAIRAGLPPALREQALARSVHAWGAAGDYQRATAAARRYLQQYPQGPNRDLVLRRLER